MAIMTIATHASASQNAASAAIALTHAHSVPAALRARSAAHEARVSRIHWATVSVIFSRGPAGAKS
jgi:hypothetical protein